MVYEITTEDLTELSNEDIMELSRIMNVIKKNREKNNSDKVEENSGEL